MAEITLANLRKMNTDAESLNSMLCEINTELDKCVLSVEAMESVTDRISHAFKLYKQLVEEAAALDAEE